MEVNRYQGQQNKRKFWQIHIRACEDSGLSQREYCRQHSLALSTFGYWRRKIKRSITDQPRFYPLTIPTLASSATDKDTGIAFYLKEKRFRIEVDVNFSPALLKKLVTTLEQM